MKRLLLIDDDTVFLNLLERALSSYAQVSIASSVHEALPLIASQRWDIICSDINMRDGTGIDIYNFMEKHDCKADFILMTAHLQSEAIQQLAASNCLFGRKYSPTFCGSLKLC